MSVNPCFAFQKGSCKNTNCKYAHILEANKIPQLYPPPLPLVTQMNNLMSFNQILYTQLQTANISISCLEKQNLELMQTLVGKNNLIMALKSKKITSETQEAKDLIENLIPFLNIDLKVYQKLKEKNLLKYLPVFIREQIDNEAYELLDLECLKYMKIEEHDIPKLLEKE